MTQQPPAGSDTGPRVTREEVLDVRAIRRASDGRMVAGVCEGLSRHFDIDPILIRVVFGALTIFGGSGLILYVIAWLTIPSDDSYDSAVSGWLRQRPERVLVAGVAIAAAATLITMLTAIGVSSPNPFPAIVLGLGIVVLFALLVRRPSPSSAATAHGVEPTTVLPAQDSKTSDTTAVLPDGSPPPPESARPWWRRPEADVGAAAQGGPPPPDAEVADGSHDTGPRPPLAPLPPPRRHAASHLLGATVAAIAIALGGTWLLDVSTLDVAPSVYPGVALGLVAAALMLGTWYGRSRTLIFVGFVAAGVTMVTTVVGSTEIGDVTYRPGVAAQVETEYQHGVGSLSVHLEGVSDPSLLDGRQIDITASVGQVDVYVPSSIDAFVDIEVDGGEITGPPGGRESGGTDQSASIVPVDDADPNVTIEVDLRYGQVNIFRIDCPGIDTSGRSTGIEQVDPFYPVPSGGPRVPAACS